jgi:hypothetical protein
LAAKHAAFLTGKLIKFVNKGPWIALPLSIIKSIPELANQLCISPGGPWWIVNYSFFLVNAETLKMAPRKAMQF